MLYVVDITLHGMRYTYIPSFMTVGSGIELILMVLPQQFESL
jgi:hypothetical protein